MLLILAGVSIATLTGDNGILGQASKAKTESTIGKEKEQIGLAFNAVKMKKISEKDNSDITAAELEEELNYNGITDAEVTGTGTLIIKFKENTYKLNQSGKIEENNENEEVIQVPENPVESFDISLNADGSVMAYLVEREGETGKYDMLIIGEGSAKRIYSKDNKNSIL